MKRILLMAAALIIGTAGVAGASTGPISLHRSRFKRTNVYAVRVPFGSGHTIHGVSVPSKHFPFALRTPAERMRHQPDVAATNEDFVCGAGRYTTARTYAPNHLYMHHREVWTTGTGNGAVYLQAPGHAWVENAAVHIHLDWDGGGVHVHGVNPCKTHAEINLYTPRAGVGIKTPPDKCYAHLTRTAAPTGAEPITTGFRVGRSACKAKPLDRPVLVSNKPLNIPQGAAVLSVDVGHPGVTEAVGGDWLTAFNGKNVAPGKPQGKDCGIHNCPDGYMGGLTPRTNLCVSKDHTTGFIVVADGRPGNAAGLTPRMVGRYDVNRLHAGACLNMDGGGSSVLVWHGKQVSHPSYGSERPVIFATGAFA